VEVGDQLVWGSLPFCTVSCDGVSQVWRRPRSDACDEQVQAAGPMHLILVGAIPKLAALADEDGATRAIDGFPIVESTQ
jgi:hypothetical protein